MEKYKIKKCLICKTEYTPKSGHQKCCSIQCFEIYRHDYIMEYNKTHKKQRAIYDKNHKEQKKITTHLYYLKHKQEINKRMRVYYYNHKEEYAKRKKINVKYRYKNDVYFKLVVILRNRIKRVLKRNSKKGHTLELLGCSVKFFKQYLENKFAKGMSWDNYGFYGWHIDHIKGCKEFDLSKKSEQRKCFHYTNLQPLWATDNLVKHCINSRY